MNTLTKVFAVAAVAIAPVVSFAQSANNQPLTRAEVRQQLIDVERAGYNPATSNDTTYPRDIQAAERRVEASQPVVAQQEPAANTSGYGAPATGSSQSGVAHKSTTVFPERSIYFGN